MGGKNGPIKIPLSMRKERVFHVSTANDHREWFGVRCFGEGGVERIDHSSSGGNKWGFGGCWVFGRDCKKGVVGVHGGAESWGKESVPLKPI